MSDQKMEGTIEYYQPLKNSISAFAEYCDHRRYHEVLGNVTYCESITSNVKLII